jgi:PAS domain-containing protein
MTDTSPNPSQDLLRAALDCMGEGVFIVDADRKILFFSAWAEDLTGIRSSDIVGQECSIALRGGVCGIDQGGLRGVALDHEGFDFILPGGHPLRVHGNLSHAKILQDHYSGERFAVEPERKNMRLATERPTS